MGLTGLTEKQWDYWHNANKKWNVKSGATRSGKTFLDYYLMPRRIAAVTGKGSILILGNTRGSIERNVIKPMQEIWGADMVSNISSKNTVQMFGKEVYALGAGKKNSVDIIRGMGVEYCYGDEVVTWDESVFAMLQSRLHLKESLFDGTCNPDDPDHWFKKFIDTKENLYSQSYELDDNTYGNPEFHDELKKAYEGTVYYDRYILGKWVKAEGLIYTNFANNPKNYFVESHLVPKRFDKITIGIDFGGGPSKHAFVATGLANGFKDVYVLASERLEPDRFDGNDLAIKFMDFMKSVEAEFGYVNKIFYDSSDGVHYQTIQTQMRKQGLNRVIRKTSKERINDRINMTTKLIGSGRLFYTNYAYTLRDAMEKALWDEREINGMKRLDNVSSDIDSLDAFEYSIQDDFWRLNQHE